MPIYEYHIRAFVDVWGDLRRHESWDVDALGTSPGDAIRTAAGGLAYPPHMVRVIGDTSIRVQSTHGKAVVFVLDRRPVRRVA